MYCVCIPVSVLLDCCFQMCLRQPVCVLISRYRVVHVHLIEPADNSNSFRNKRGKNGWRHTHTLTDTDRHTHTHTQMSLSLSILSFPLCFWRLNKKVERWNKDPSPRNITTMKHHDDESENPPDENSAGCKREFGGVVGVFARWMLVFCKVRWWERRNEATVSVFALVGGSRSHTHTRTHAPQ